MHFTNVPKRNWNSTLVTKNRNTHAMSMLDNNKREHDGWCYDTVAWKHHQSLLTDFSPYDQEVQILFHFFFFSTQMLLFGSVVIHHSSPCVCHRIHMPTITPIIITLSVMDHGALPSLGLPNQLFLLISMVTSVRVFSPCVSFVSRVMSFFCLLVLAMCRHHYK